MISPRRNNGVLLRFKSQMQKRTFIRAARKRNETLTAFLLNAGARLAEQTLAKPPEEVESKSLEAKVK